MKTITTEELNKIKENLLNSMKTLFKRDKGLDPVTILVSQDGQLAFVPTPFRTHIEKQMMVEGIKLVCQKTNPAAVVTINEAWFKQMKGGEKEAREFEKELKDTGRSVSDYDDKKEVAIMMFETADGHEMIIHDIDRVNNDLINEERSNQVEGIFCNLLTPIKTA